MNTELRHFVRERAAGRCEYCRTPEAFLDLPFQIEHIIAKKHKGEDDADNLAHSCYNCNAFKGPNIAGIDPNTGQLTRLFHPRADRWEHHFSWLGPENCWAQPMSAGRQSRFLESIGKSASP